MVASLDASGEEVIAEACGALVEVGVAATMLAGHDRKAVRNGVGCNLEEVRKVGPDPIDRHRPWYTGRRPLPRSITEQTLSRPSQHGGGQSGPPIAGDPSTFPSDAELARTLAATATRATLSTLTAEGYPYGSAVSYAADDEGAPILLVSDMAEHTVNARGDDRASLLIAADTPPGADPLSTARMTLVGRLRLLDEPGERRTRYLDVHPYASYYADFTDFGFWLLDVEQCRFVGGFGHMSWFDAAAYAAATVDPVAEAAEGIIEHMNTDHAEANLLYATALAGLTDATDATMVGIDRHGITLRVTTPDAPRMARLGFPEPLAGAEDARPAVIELLATARAKSAPTD